MASQSHGPGIWGQGPSADDRRRLATARRSRAFGPATIWVMHVRSEEGEERVTSLELFFDLVFVFAITQVTGFLAANETWEGLLRGFLLLAALWWAWEAYAWLTNTLDPEEGAVRLAVFASAGSMLIVALATPEAFGDEALVFAVAYAIVRALHL